MYRVPVFESTVTIVGGSLSIGELVQHTESVGDDDLDEHGELENEMVFEWLGLTKSGGNEPIISRIPDENTRNTRHW